MDRVLAQASIWLMEFVLTALLVFTVFSATDNVRNTQICGASAMSS